MIKNKNKINNLKEDNKLKFISLKFLKNNKNKYNKTKKTFSSYK
jgi:hypothetical protein